MTHWHPDDPAGRIIKQMITNPNGDKWEILDLPGMMEGGTYALNREEQRKKMLEGVYMSTRDALGRQPGEVLCPAMLPRTEMLKIRETQNDYYFQALYQQRPYSREGQRYKREWFTVIPKLPEGVTFKDIVRYWDKANSSAGDYTAGVLMAYGSDGYFYILDVARGQWTSYERDQKMRKAAEADKATYGNVHSNVQTWHQQDPGSAGKDSAEATNRLLMGFPAFFETVTGDKQTRSEPLESAFQGKLVFMLQGAWNEAFTSECVAFPRGQHDDQVDAASSAYNKLLSKINHQTPGLLAYAQKQLEKRESVSV
jgi:predicted phage terminase large subunit-like protein